MTRAQAADLLARAFNLTALESIDDNYAAMYGKARYEKATYDDVPLYSEVSAVVEAWHATGTVPPCKRSSALFCPDAPLTTGEFIDSVTALNGKKAGAHMQDSAALRNGVAGKDNDQLTRGDAVLILFNGEQ